MTTRQQRRREDAIRAVIELVAERGAESLQMRDVAERSGVALGTLYRYFASKDHLVAVALMSWARALEDQVVRRHALEQDPSWTMAERLSAILRLGVRPFRRQPNFARVLIQVGASTDPHASACYLELGAAIRATLGRAIPELDPDTRERVLQVVGSVWYHALVEWVSGRITIAQVQQRLDSACQLLLEGAAVGDLATHKESAS